MKDNQNKPNVNTNNKANNNPGKKSGNKFGNKSGNKNSNNKSNNKYELQTRVKTNSESNALKEKDDSSNMPAFKWQYLVVYLLIASLLSFGLIEFKIKKDTSTSTTEQTVKVSVTSDDGSFDVDKQTGEKVEQIEEPGTIGEKYYGTTVPSESSTDVSNTTGAITSPSKKPSSSHSGSNNDTQKNPENNTTNTTDKTTASTDSNEPTTEKTTSAKPTTEKPSSTTLNSGE